MSPPKFNAGSNWSTYASRSGVAVRVPGLVQNEAAAWKVFPAFKVVPEKALDVTPSLAPLWSHTAAPSKGATRCR